MTKKEMKNNAGSVLFASRVRWKNHGGIRSGKYTGYYCRGERAEEGVPILVHKSILRRLSVTIASFVLR